VARALVRQACRDWDIPIQTEHAAALVVSELALNAVVHAASPLCVSVKLTDQALSVSVRDLRPDLPLRLIPRGRAPRLLGLQCCVYPRLGLGSGAAFPGMHTPSRPGCSAA
jgi:hypothetical protein